MSSFPNSNVRIAVISPFVDRQHGTERAVAELIDHLVEHFKDCVDLYAQRVSDVGLKSNAAAGTAARGELTWHPVRTLPGPHLFRFLGWFFLNGLARRKHEKASGNAPDVVFSPGINALDADVILVHVVFHRLAELQKSQPSNGLRSLHRKLYYALICGLERRVYKNARVTLAAVSRHTAEQLEHYFGRNDAPVIPYGVDSGHFSTAAIATMREKNRLERKCSASDFVMLLIGNDWRNKGLATLLEALRSCEDLPIRLLVVGHDDQAFFRSKTETLGIAGRVQFFPCVQDIRQFYAAADLLVAPSLEDSFNLPVLEAMSCGLPVIVSPCAGVSDWLTNMQDSIVLKAPDNADELREAIRMLALDPTLRSSIAANALETAKRFSWDTHASLLRELMVTVARKKARHDSQTKR